MSLTYQEIVEKMKNKEGISSAEITTEQLLMLFHDGYLRTVTYGHTLYELNLIPVEDNKYKYWAYDKLDCVSSLTKIVKMLIEGQLVYILIQDEPFQVNVEILETNE